MSAVTDEISVSGSTSGLSHVLEGGVDITHGPILYLDDITVSFEGFKALNKLTLTVEAGELRCVIGPNGAGKTTMMDVITGKTRPDEGSAFFGQTIDLTRLTEPEIAHAGIGRKFQKPTIFRNHTVFENLEVALKTDKRVAPTLRARRTTQQQDRIDEVLEVIGLCCKADRKADLLSHGEKQWLEIGMVMVQDAELLLVDEPVAGMTDEETEKTGHLLRGVAEERAVLVIEHDMEFVRSIARTVTVLHEGGVLCEGPVDRIQKDERVMEVYLGRSRDADE